MRRSGPDQRRGRRAGDRPALFAALWTLIVVTLLSALTPLGPPLSRAKGSAFNPATSEVVLKGRAASLAKTASAIRPRRGTPPYIAISPLRTRGYGISSGVVASWRKRLSPVHLAVSLARDGLTRAPPVA